jgi:hypothetical protein
MGGGLSAVAQFEARCPSCFVLELKKSAAALKLSFRAAISA